VSKISQFRKFIRFFSKADTIYRVHSPFVYEFVQAVLEDERNFYAFVQLENLRKLMLQSPQKIHFEDHGAGSHSLKNSERSIRDIAATSLSPPFQCRWLFRMVQLYKPKTILELGTSLGLSTLYQYYGARNSNILTLEGSTPVARIAMEHFRQNKARSIHLKIGPFRQTLDSALQELGHLDYVFFDGHHNREATLDYFQRCLPYVGTESVLIFDDIYWSQEMTAAWEIIKNHERVTISIDLFFMGVVFFRKENHQKQHFKLVRSTWKPWVMGFNK